MKKSIFNNTRRTKAFNQLRNAILLLALGLFSLTSFATEKRSQRSELTISLSERSAKFIVIIDDYQTKGQGAVLIDNIKPGKHRLKIVQVHQSRCSYENGYTVLHKGILNVPKNSKMTGVIRPNRGLRIVKVEPLHVYNNYNSHQGHDHHNHGQQDNYNSNYSDDCDMCAAQCNTDPVISPCGTMEVNDFNYQEQSYDNSCTEVIIEEPVESHDLYTQYMIDHDMYNDNSSTMPSSYYGSFMSDYELEHLVEELEDAWFDSDRLQIAKRRIKAKKVTSEQVLEIMRQFSFESSRLEIAKYAYDYTIDQDNYYEVNDGFEFSSSVNELEELIN